MYYILSKIRKTKTRDFDAYLLVGLLMYFNFVTIAVFYCHFFNINMKATNENTPVFLGLFLGILIMAINHIALYSKRASIFKKYKFIFKERKNERLIYFWIYVVLSFSTLFVAIEYLT